MKKQLLFLLFFLSAVTIYAQRTVTGVVTSADDGMPVIGASVLVKGTTQGTITDIDGNYSINASDNSVLVFSFVGLDSKEIKVGTQSVINVVMKSSSIMVDEVVVTAMGVKAEKKKLNFAVQSLDASEITAGQAANFVSSLQGKVAGVQVTSGGGSPNSGTAIQIRAISSINPGQNNEPLFIIDGIAVNGSATNMGNINPNDIENMTVLKGAAAAALYGHEAANGVVMITTKTGKAGAIQVNASASIQIDNCTRVPEIQSIYGPGAQGFYKAQTAGGWGPLLQPGEKSYDNVGSFLGTGIYQKYDVSASGGTEKYNAYASVNYTMNDGVIPKDYKNQLGALLKSTFNVSKHLKITMQANITNISGRGFGSVMSDEDSMNSLMSRIYGWPINDDMSHYKNADGSIHWRYDLDGLTDLEKQDAPVNPNWLRYEDSGKSETSRNILMGSVNYTPVKNLELVGKISYDQNNYDSEAIATPRFEKDDFESPGSIALDKFGKITYRQSKSQLLTAQALATYKWDITRDWNLNALAGYELKELKTKEAKMGGSDFIIPGDFYSIQNLDKTELGKNTELYHVQKRNYAYFGELRIDYKGIAHASATARQDYTSTLSKKSYFYPSVTAGLIFSELFNISNNIFSYGKVRGNWARVGKDTSAYRFGRKFRQLGSFPDQGYGVDPTSSVATYLDPEMCDSWEVGVDLRFFNDKTKLDVAYYSTQVDNQIVSVRVSPAAGNILETRNEGSVKNYGVEIQLTQQIMRSKDFSWDAMANFSLNRGKVVSLPDGILEIQGSQFGDAFPTAYLNHSTTAISGKDYLRTPDGQIICSEDGTPQLNPAKGVLIGDREPDFLLGISSNFRWKDLKVSFLLDTRKGGDVLNVTGRSLLSNGQLKSLETYRNRWVVFDGVVDNGDGTYRKNTQPILLNQTNITNCYYNATSNFVEDGSYIRLSHVTVEYDFSRYLQKTACKGLRVSLTGRNLFLLTKYTGSDPQINANPSARGSGQQGIDYFAVPSTRSFNLTVNATF